MSADNHNQTCMCQPCVRRSAGVGHRVHRKVERRLDAESVAWREMMLERFPELAEMKGRCAAVTAGGLRITEVKTSVRGRVWRWPDGRTAVVNLPGEAALPGLSPRTQVTSLQLGRRTHDDDGRELPATGRASRSRTSRARRGFSDSIDVGNDLVYDEMRRRAG